MSRNAETLAALFDAAKAADAADAAGAAARSPDGGAAQLMQCCTVLCSIFVSFLVILL